MLAVLNTGNGAARRRAMEPGGAGKAVRHHLWAAVGKATPHIGCRGTLAPALLLRREPLTPCLGARDRRDQQPRVGMLWRVHDRLDRAGLDDVGTVHHKDRIADLVGG